MCWQRRALELTPSNTETQAALAYVMAMQGRLAEAGTIWRAAINADPLAASDDLTGARIVVGLGSLDESDMPLRKAIGLQPAISHAYTYLTMIDLQLGCAASGDVPIGTGTNNGGTKG